MALMDKTKNPEFGILVDYEWCTGCHSCEMACQMEHGYGIEQGGVKVFEMGPWEIEPDKWEYDYTITFGDQCDLCSDRIEKGKLPTCVKHCQAKCLSYGKLEDLCKQLTNHPKQALFAL